MKAMIENNRAVLGLMALLVVIVLGFVWWQFMYKPATTENNAAMMANQSAQAALNDAQTRLATAQQEVNAAKRENGGKFDTSIAKVQVAREAVPSEERIDDALIVLEKYAKRSGIRTDWSLSTSGVDAGSSEPAANDTGDAKPVVIKVSAAGKWSQLKSFIGYVESSASSERGNLHIRGRIFNVVQVRVSSPEAAAETSSSAGDYATAGASASSGIALKKGEYQYELAIEMYTSSFGADAAAAATGGGAPAGSGVATTPGAGSATTPGAATGTDPAAAAGAAAGGGTAGTTGTAGAAPTDTSGAGATTPTPGTAGGATTPTGTGSTGTTPTSSGTAGVPSTTGVSG